MKDSKDMRYPTMKRIALIILALALDPELTLFDFDRRHRVEIAASRRQVQEAFASLADVELVLLNNVNPVFSIPGSDAITRVLSEKKRFVVAFSNFMDETAALADLIVPVQMALETWDAFESNPACLSTLQPAMGRTHFIPALGDMLLNLLPADQRPAADYKTLVTQTVLEGSGNTTASQWLKTIQQGGRFTESGRRGKTPRTNIKAASALAAACVETLPEPTDSPTLVVPPSVRFFDGRGANRPWLIETPDTLTQIPWQTTALAHPDTLNASGIREGEVLLLKTAKGEIEVPAYAYEGVFPCTVVVPAGQDFLTIETSGGTGDCDMHVKKGSKPTTSSYDYRPYLIGNNESVEIVKKGCPSWAVRFTNGCLRAVSRTIEVKVGGVPEQRFHAPTDPRTPWRIALDGAGEIEIYDRGRYFTVTGNRLPATRNRSTGRVDKSGRRQPAAGARRCRARPQPRRQYAPAVPRRPIPRRAPVCLLPGIAHRTSHWRCAPDLGVGTRRLPRGSTIVRCRLRKTRLMETTSCRPYPGCTLPRALAIRRGREPATVNAGPRQEPRWPGGRPPCRSGR